MLVNKFSNKILNLNVLNNNCYGNSSWNLKRIKNMNINDNGVIFFTKKLFCENSNIVKTKKSKTFLLNKNKFTNSNLEKDELSKDGDGNSISTSSQVAPSLCTSASTPPLRTSNSSPTPPIRTSISPPTPTQVTSTSPPPTGSIKSVKKIIKINLSDENIEISKHLHQNSPKAELPSNNLFKKGKQNSKINIEQDSKVNKTTKNTLDKTLLKENYACVYYKFPIDQEFNLFHLRNLLYSYIFTRQRNGHIYLNLADSQYKANVESKNKKFEELMGILDWLDISLDFDDKFKNKLFESQRIKEYDSWLKHLMDQKDAYKCFCKNYLKCEGNCKDSTENMDLGDSSNDGFKLNKDVIYVRFRNKNKFYKYYDYMTAERKEFESNDQGDFLLYKNFNEQYLDSFKRVIDDNSFSVTHIIEDTKSFNPYKNAILTKHLLFNEKKYIELPNIKVKYWNQEDYQKIDITYLKSRLFLPEAILNESLMLGYTKNPAKEYKDLLINNKDKDVADWGKVMWEFEISNISKIGSVFDFRRLIYLNKRNLIKKFIKSHESIKKPIFEEFKQNFKILFKDHQQKFVNWDHEDWRKMIYLITPNLFTYEDLYTFYFLFEPPIVSAITKENKKAIKGFLLDEDYKKFIIKDIDKIFSKIEKFDSKNIHKEISYYIFKKYQKDRSISSVNFYSFLKLIITGYADAPNLGEICEIIGKNEVLQRIKDANKITKQAVVENIKFLKDKKEKSILLLNTNNNPSLISSSQTAKLI